MNPSFTSEELVNLGKHKLGLEQQDTGISDSIDFINNTSIPNRLTIEALYKKFFVNYNNVLGTLDESRRYLKGFEGHGIEDYEGDPYPDSGYEIQKGTYLTGNPFFPSGYYGLKPYPLPWYSQIDVYNPFVIKNKIYNDSEYDYLEDEYYAIDTGIPGEIGYNTAVNNEKIKLTNAHNYLKTAIDLCPPEYTNLYDGLNYYYYFFGSELVYLEQPYNWPLSSLQKQSRLPAINAIKGEIDNYISYLENNTDLNTISGIRYHWLNRRLNRAYGILQQIYYSHMSVGFLTDKKTSNETTIEIINNL